MYRLLSRAPEGRGEPGGGPGGAEGDLIAPSPEPSTLPDTDDVIVQRFLALACWLSDQSTHFLYADRLSASSPDLPQQRRIK